MISASSLTRLVALAVALTTWSSVEAAERSFSIDYERHVFLKDGEPFRYISGEIHYNRIHPAYWRDRLQRLRAAGLNAVQVYVPWNLHEPQEGHFEFGGIANVTGFIQEAQQQGLLVLLRAGPYICAEWENGGLPYWLLNKTNIELRVYNSAYLSAVKTYFNKMLPKFKPLLYQNGGPIIMVQVENEYGSYNSDKRYKNYLRDLFKSLLGPDALLYTTDGAGDHYLKGGVIDGIFPTVDFGPTKKENVAQYFDIQKRYSKGGPLVNSEFYPGWFTLWGGGKPGLPNTQQVLETMRAMYDLGASFSFYMFHGGTNFGFWNGAETDGPVITSYDYAAPVSENGDLTLRYEAVRSWISQLPNWSTPPLTPPQNNSARAYGSVEMTQTHDLLTGVQQSLLGCQETQQPISFEALGHAYGFVLYRTKLTRAGVNLTAENLKDHGYVFLNKLAQGTIVHSFHDYSKKWVELKNAKVGDTVAILVENRGRQTYLTIQDRKGLLPDVTLDGQPLLGWSQCGVDMSENSVLAHLQSARNAWPDDRLDTAGVYTGTFDIEGDIKDTWFHPRGFRKGQLLINGFNVGRYWSSAGPQITLYVPAPILKAHNSIVMVELQGRQPASNIGFVSGPVDQRTPWRLSRRVGERFV